MAYPDANGFRQDEPEKNPLDVPVSYLFSVVEEDLASVTRVGLDELRARYDGETSIRARERYWEEIRRAIRKLDGEVSGCYEFNHVFQNFARERFDSIWRSLGFKERGACVDEFKFDRFGDPRIKRPDFYNSRRCAWEQTRRRIERVFGVFTDSERERIHSRMIDDANVAFAMCEYVYAIDDYDAWFECPECEVLLEKLMCAIREIVFPSAVPEVEGESEKSAPDDFTEKHAQQGKDADIEPNDLKEKNVDKELDDEENALDDESRERNELDAAFEDIQEVFDDSEEDSEEPVGVYELVRNFPDGYFPIDERVAANAKRAVSFDDYVENSATREYRKEVDSARQLAETQKNKVDERAQRKIDRMLYRFERWLASWYDRRNIAEAYCPSILVVGAGNFPRTRHQKKMERLAELFAERDKIFALLARIESVGTGGIRSDDPNALEKLQEKLKYLTDHHEEMKRANAYLRRFGAWAGYDRPEFVKDSYTSRGEPTSFYLASSNQEIRRIEGRIELLKYQAATDYGEGWRFEGGVASVDKAEGRLQIRFDEIPDVATKTVLKGRGFRWSPRNKAWQRQLTPDAIWAAKRLGYIPKDWRPKRKNENDEDK